MDRLLAFLALCVTFPLILLIALIVAIDSPGGPFLLQKREGYKKKTITVIKFRTMYSKNETFDIDHAVIGDTDSRVTRVGRFLRRSKLDELPQLINILKGDMSFVGPRPLLSVYFKRYERWEFQKFAVLPGLTGLSQVRGNGYLDVDHRSYYDVLYSEKCSLFMDIKIILLTLGVIFRGEKAFIREPSPEELSTLKYRYQSPEGRITVGEVIGNAELGGVKSVVTNYLDHMDLSGFDMHIFTYGPSAADKHFAEKGWTVHYLPNFIKFPLAKRAFRKELSLRHYDIIHSHLTSLSLFPLKEAQKAGVDVRICHAHSTTSPKERVSVVKNYLKRFSTKYATHLCACGKKSAAWLYGEQGKDALILNNAIDLDRFAFSPVLRAEKRLEHEIPEDAFVIGTVARFELQKNIGCLLTAFSLLPKEENAYLLLVGDGSERRALEKKALALGISDRVRFVGESEEPWAYYSAMDLFALPSLYEGLPVVGIEAQANGLPCLFSKAVTEEIAIADNVYFTEATPECFMKGILEACGGRVNNTDKLREAGYDIRIEAEKLVAYYKEGNRDAERKLRCKVYRTKIAGREWRFKAPPFLPWRVLIAIAEAQGGLDGYVDEDGYLLYEELESDYREKDPDGYESILSEVTATSGTKIVEDRK